MSEGAPDWAADLRAKHDALIAAAEHLRLQHRELQARVVELLERQVALQAENMQLRRLLGVNTERPQ